MKQYPFYEVKSYGVTIEMDKNYKVAESAFNQAGNAGYGQVIMYRLDPATSKKSVVKRK